MAGAGATLEIKKEKLREEEGVGGGRCLEYPEGDFPLFSRSGIPFPIIVAWAIGKLYYDNEK